MVDEIIKKDIDVIRKLYILLENVGVMDTKEILDAAKADLKNRNL